VAIPFVNVRRGPTVLQSAPDDSDQYVAHAFVGAAHAVRRDVFLALGGYRQHLYYMGEEGDLCLRMLAAGYVTRLGRADSVHHLESTNRVSERADFYGRQNDILFVWQNAPSRYLLPHLAGTILLGLRYAVNSAKYPLAMLRGTGSAFLHILRGEAMREPVALKAYGLYRRLKRSGPLRLKEIEAELPETLAV